MEKKVLVIGLAQSGLAAINLLKQKDYQITLTTNDNLSKEVKDKLDLFEIYDGGHPLELLNNKYDFIIKNPGIPYHNPFIKQAILMNHKIITEIELAYMYSKNFIYAITGTNGKTTTVTMLYDILLKHYKTNIFLAGNIGIPYSEIALNNPLNNHIVLELSNFQLLGINTFKPKIASILNLAPDHLDYMDSLDEYYQSKMKIYSNQDKDDYFLLNLDDEVLLKYALNIPSKVITYSINKSADIFLKDNNIYYGSLLIIDCNKLKVVGIHNIYNVMVAIGYAMILDVPINIIREAIYAFNGVEYRLQKKIGKDNVVYYNDSKATSPEATLTAVKAMSDPFILIIGGFDKKLSYQELSFILNNNNLIKEVLTFGEIGLELSKMFYKSTNFNNLRELINYLRITNNKDTVLFSPGTSSFDQFKNYEERGAFFNELISEVD